MAARDDRQEAADTDPRAPRDRPVESELREQIRSRWQDLVAGRAPHDDIRRWARRQLEGSVADNELDIHLTEDDVTLVLHSVTK